MATHPAADAARQTLGATQRIDAWWAGPAATALGLGAFVVDATLRAFYNADYQLGIGTETLREHAYLLSPFYSPLLRQESRGAHTRDDFPDTEANWGKLNVIVRKTGPEMSVVTEPLPVMPQELQKIMRE
jgi:hypothetical protein